VGCRYCCYSSFSGYIRFEGLGRPYGVVRPFDYFGIGLRLGQLVPARYNIVTGPIQVSDDEGYQPEEGLMSLVHCAHEDEIPTEVSLMYIYLIIYI